jgi:hypothetical protein
MSAAPDPTEEIKLTNSTTTSIVLLLPTVSAETQDANGTLVYDQPLELLTAVDGSTSIPAGSAKTFVLDQTYVDPDTGQNEYSTIYDLLPSTAKWFAPVANIGVMQSFANPPSYPAQTVTAASAKAFQNAGTFIQTISSYPTSALATSYQQAMGQASTNASGQANGSSGSSGAAAQSISDTVNAFFKGTKTYKDVTLEAVVAVQSYYATFPFVWAEYATGATTYYLYSSNGTATSFVGTLSLTPPAALNVAVANAGYTCTFTPAANGSDTSTVAVTTSAAKSLTYAGGLFVDNVDSDVPLIAIKGTFQIKSLFTGKAADTQIITVLTGTVNSSTCIGFDSPQLSTDSSSTFWDTMFHPKNSAQIFQSIMQIGGALMLLVFAGQGLYGIYKWARGLAAKDKPMTLEDFNTKLQESLKTQQESFEAAIKKLTDAKGNAPADAEVAQSEVSVQTEVVGDNASSIKIQDGLDAQASSLESLAEFAPSMTRAQLTSLESVAGKVRTSSEALSEAPTDNLGPVVEAQAPQLATFNTEIVSLKTDVGSAMSEAAEASITSNTELVETAVKELNEISEGQDSIGSDDAPKAEDPIEVPDL